MDALNSLTLKQKQQSGTLVKVDNIKSIIAVSYSRYHIYIKRYV